MKILFLFLVLLINSCGYIDLNNLISHNKFEQLIKENFFDSELSLRKIPNDNLEIKIIKVQKIEDIVSTIVNLSVELKEHTIVHFVEFSTDERFEVDEEIIKNLAKNKNCDLVVYVEVEGIRKYTLSSDRQTLNLKEKEGFKFFNAFFYSKVKMDRIIEIKSN